MYLLLLILLHAGGFLVFLLVRLVHRDIQAHRRHEAYRDYIMAFGSEEEKESFMMDEMEDLIIGMGRLVLIDMIDGELDGDIDLW